MNSIFKGRKIELEVYGGSHEPVIGFKLKGFPKTKINFDNITKSINRRKPNKPGATERKESDIPVFISGFDNNMTNDEVIEVQFKNENINKKDYSLFYDHPRPGHVDYVVRKKYGEDGWQTGAGIFSGRMTLPLVVAGALCLEALEVSFDSKILQVGTLTNMDELDNYLLELKNKNESAGGIVEVVVKGVPLGLGGPLFDKISIKIAQTILAIPGVKGIEFGEGFNSTNLLGSEYNDLLLNKEGKTKTNHVGGINGGITNGNDLVVRVAFRPPSSISQPQKTYSFKTDKVKNLEIKGRHDVSYVPRALIAVESMIALALLDELL